MTTITLDSPERVEYAQRVLGKLPVSERPFACTIEPHREKRSLKANARLWALHSKAAAHLGYSAEDMHEFALCRHYGHFEQRVVNPHGEVITRHVPLKRSSTRNVGEFAAFMEATEAWYISEFGVFLGDEQ